MYAEVILDITNRRLDRTYHYLVPEGLKIRQGMRVLVPLQGRQVQALVVAVSTALPEDAEDKKLRPVLRILDNEAVPQEMVELARWLSETTICSVAQSLHAVWPLLKGKVEDWVVPLASPEDPDVQALKWLDAEAYARLAVLFRSRRKALSVPVFLARSGAEKSDLEALVAQGWVRLETRFTHQWQSNALASDSGSGSEPQALAGNAPGSASGCGLESQALAGPEISTRLLTKTLPPSSGPHSEEPILTAEQLRAVEEVTSALAGKQFETILLYGVTGSGKTEVYRRAIRQVLETGGDAILLVPEISLTDQLYRYLEEEFGSQMLILHSGLKPKEKAEAWAEMLTGAKHLVIGARSAVFAPLPNLRLIILDEEHDSAYKQDENPKYHARDVARRRMEQRGGVVLLGSATPSLEAFAAAQTGKIQLVTLKERVKRQPLPAVEIVDMRTELAAGNRSIFSLSLQAKLRERLERGEQSMLFLNRRGYSTFVVCRECGYVVRCPDCDVTLTYHAHAEEMRCHYCSHTEKPPHNCPSCGSRYIRFFGLGTERVEEELRATFPGLPLLRLDLDTTRASGHQEIMERFRRQEAQVLIGTQMMAKGLDFPNVTLVGVIAADQTLQMPDFRARERTFQLLTQVAGRAGRSIKPGEVVIQTYVPQDRAIFRASHHDFQGFFWEEIRYRKERHYPPFTNVIRVILQHEQEERVIKGAQELSMILRQRMPQLASGHTELNVLELNVLGPAPAVLTRLKKQFRWQVSLKGKDLRAMRSILHRSVAEFFQGPASSGIVLNIEVNPLSP